MSYNVVQPGPPDKHLQLTRARSLRPPPRSIFDPWDCAAAARSAPQQKRNPFGYKQSYTPATTIMTPRLLLLCLMLGTSSSLAHAQLRIAPFVTGTLGVTDLRNRIRIQTSPPTTNVAATHSGNILAAVSAGLAFGEHIAADLTVRSSVEIRQPFRAFTLGGAIRWGTQSQLYVRAGFGGVHGFEAVDCTASASSCGPYDSEWTAGFDLSAGLNLRGDKRWSIGPVLWWAQSMGSDTQYRSLGLGVQLRYR